MSPMDWQIRNSGGVAIRRDGKGDPWAMDHRRLGRGWNMRDGDEIHRCTWEIEHRENMHFSDMVFDSYANRGKLIRRCATLCRTDRKASVEIAEREIESGAVCIAHLLQECRNDKLCQGGHGGRAFIVCGDDYPYIYIELDPETGMEMRREPLLNELAWHDLYKRLGLDVQKNQLEQWLLGSCLVEGKYGR